MHLTSTPLLRPKKLSGPNDSGFFNNKVSQNKSIGNVAFNIRSNNNLEVRQPFTNKPEFVKKFHKASSFDTFNNSSSLSLSSKGYFSDEDINSSISNKSEASQTSFNLSNFRKSHLESKNIKAPYLLNDSRNDVGKNDEVSAIKYLDDMAKLSSKLNVNSSSPQPIIDKVNNESLINSYEFVDSIQHTNSKILVENDSNQSNLSYKLYNATSDQSCNHFNDILNEKNKFLESNKFYSIDSEVFRLQSGNLITVTNNWKSDSSLFDHDANKLITINDFEKLVPFSNESKNNSNELCFLRKEISHLFCKDIIDPLKKGVAYNNSVEKIKLNNSMPTLLIDENQNLIAKKHRSMDINISTNNQFNNTIYDLVASNNDININEVSYKMHSFNNCSMEGYITDTSSNILNKHREFLDFKVDKPDEYRLDKTKYFSDFYDNTYKQSDNVKKHFKAYKSLPISSNKFRDNQFGNQYMCKEKYTSIAEESKRIVLVLPNLLGLDSVDFIQEFSLRNAFFVINKIFSYLSEPDLCRISCVSKSWSKVIECNFQSSIRRSKYLKQLKIKLSSPNKENSKIINKNQIRDYTNSIVRAPLTEVQRVKSLNPQKNEDLRLNNTQIFWKAATELKPGEDLRKCIRCQHVSKLTSKKIYTCTKLNCGIRFCSFCHVTVESINSHECVVHPVNNNLHPNKEKSKWNLKRLR